MADKPDDVKDPIAESLAEDQPAKAESSPEETKTEKAEKPKAEAKPTDDTAEKPKPEETKETEDEAEVTPPSSDETKEEQPQGKAEERKTQLNTEIRDLVAKKNELKGESFLFCK